MDGFNLEIDLPAQMMNSSTSVPDNNDTHASDLLATGPGPINQDKSSNSNLHGHIISSHRNILQPGCLLTSVLMEDGVPNKTNSVINSEQKVVKIEDFQNISLSNESTAISLGVENNNMDPTSSSITTNSILSTLVDYKSHTSNQNLPSHPENVQCLQNDSIMNEAISAMQQQRHNRIASRRQSPYVSGLSSSNSLSQDGNLIHNRAGNINSYPCPSPQVNTLQRPSNLVALIRMMVQERLGKRATSNIVVTPQHSVKVKEWHQQMTNDLRKNLIDKLVRAILPPGFQGPNGNRVQNLVSYCQKVEFNIYEAANSKNEYYHLFAVKYYEMQKELDEQRLKRREQQQEQKQNTEKIDMK